MAFALAGFSLLVVGDSIVKSIAGAWPGIAVAALRFSIGAFGLAVILFVREGRAGFQLPLPRLQLLRGLSLALATTCFFSSIFLMPLAVAISITFTSPFITAFYCRVFLKEEVPRGAGVAAIIAFAGVLLVLRPNVAAIGIAALLPLIAAMAMSAMIIGNRMVAGAGSVLQMQFLISLVTAPILVAGAIIGNFSGFTTLAIDWPDWQLVAKCVIVAVTATISHSLIFQATVHASAATITPMVYVQMLIAIAIGWAVFGDVPDATTLGGGALIIAGGLYMWRQQRKPA